VRKIGIEELGDALYQPWNAIMATRRRDGTPLLSPMAFEWDGEAFLLPVLRGDWKERHIQENSSWVTICIAETALYPGRLLEAAGNALVEDDPDGDVCIRIISRYMGDELAEDYVRRINPYVTGKDRRGLERIEWAVIRLVPERFRALDHRDEEYCLDAKPKFITVEPQSPMS
jgi:hypothetical protein